MEPFNLIFAAMLALTPERYRPAEGSEKEGTYKAIATDIHVAATEPLHGLPFDGPKAVEATEYALVAISANESSYRQEVRDCRIKGDNGRSISIFQLLVGPGRAGHKEKEICEEPVLAAKLAIDVLNWYQYSRTPEQLFNGYATGHASNSNDASKRQFNSFMKLAKAANIKISKKKGFSRLYAEDVDSKDSPPLVSSTNGSRTWLISVTTQ